MIGYLLIHSTGCQRDNAGAPFLYGTRDAANADAASGDEVVACIEYDEETATATDEHGRVWK